MAIFATDWLLVGIKFETLEAGLMVAGAMTLVNVFIKPLLQIFAFPITMMTLGFFPFFLNTGLVLVVAHFVNGFKIYGDYLFVFLWAAAFSIVLTVVTFFIETFTGYNLPGGK